MTKPLSKDTCFPVNGRTGASVLKYTKGFWESFGEGVGKGKNLKDKESRELLVIGGISV